MCAVWLLNYEFAVKFKALVTALDFANILLLFIFSFLYKFSVLIVTFDFSHKISMTLSKPKVSYSFNGC